MMIFVATDSVLPPIIDVVAGMRGMGEVVHGRQCPEFRKLEG
jgi:hypothetical protein